ncbi:hypothetical protein [Corynebacterium glyciniphilum]|uniref:hypothetical protein n=1 Tax=Corynebacterium glyciniphilum TaxID=1404244 RepID=UPI00264F2A73|nr:hypothetical protein [Corynebacterium glyciniphilum]MDN5683060.1 hypothetical protein [Corynebacterium glyciniphilum]MDN6704584.1 hypothetical protein [Corynebacterium glyciniphilum]
MLDLLPQLVELARIIGGVLGGDFSELSTEGSLAGNGSAAEVGGSLVGSAIGSLGLEEDLEGALGSIPGVG